MISNKNMDCKKFCKNNSILKFLYKFGLIEKILKVIRINNHPDYDITEYEREIDTTYYFHNYWEFKELFFSVFNIEIIDNKVFSFDHLTEISKELGIEFNENFESEFLELAYLKNKETVEIHDFGTSWDEFKLNNLRIRSIDNLNKKVYIEGSFFGNHVTIEPDYWGIYSFLLIEKVPLEINNYDFYKSLLIESYLLYQSGNYKLSYFIGFSAIESFVNKELGKEDEKKRLNEKLTELFASKFDNICKHQIYSSIVNDFSKFTDLRNSIAHGKDKILIERDLVEKILLFSLILISSYKTESITFDELNSKLENSELID